MSWGSSGADPHGIITFNHRTDRLALVREQSCHERDCPRGCWIHKAYRRSHDVLEALEGLYRLDLACTDGDPHMWRDGLYTGSYLQSSCRNIGGRFQPSRGGVKAAGIKVPTPTHFVVVGLVASADVGKKALLPGGMEVLHTYRKSKTRKSTSVSPGQGMFLPTSTYETPLLDWEAMQFWQRRIKSLWNPQGSVSPRDWDQKVWSYIDNGLVRYIKELRSLLEARTPRGLLFRLLLNRPIGEGVPNISPLGPFWTDPKRRYCLGADSPAHPSLWVTSLQILVDGEWETWRGDEPPKWGEQRWIIEEDRTTWNLTYDVDGKTKLCYFCRAKTEAYWQDQRLGANGVALGELASRVGEVSPYRNGTGFSVELADWSYDELNEALAGKTVSKAGVSKRLRPDMATVAKTLHNGLQPSVEEAEELVAKFMAEVAKGRR